MTWQDVVGSRLKDAKRVVFVTGSGISQESGIPTFRGRDGYWRNHDVMKLATIDAFYDNPGLVWKWYDERRRNILAAKPNAGHRAISALEKFVCVSVLTQNIDGLHGRAGSTDILELHGSIIKIKCTVCDFTGENIAGLELPPMCECGSMLRPDVVWFGEPLPPEVWNDAVRRAGMAQVMIIVGTSLVVSPANMLPAHARDNGAMLIEINPEKTAMSEYMDVSIRESASTALPKILDVVGDQSQATASGGTSCKPF